MAALRLPRLLVHSVEAGLDHEVRGSTLHEALDDLFRSEPGLRSHLLDESGAIRPHVSIFVDGERGSLETAVGESSQIRVLQAVSGG